MSILITDFYLPKETFYSKTAANQVKNTKKLGNHGEDIAAAFLKHLNYRILERQYRFKRGDIDLICMDPSDAQTGEKALVFVEVKTRKNYRFGRPEDAVTAEKQRRIIRVARAYLHKRRMEEMQCRFDVVAVTLRKGMKPKVKHLKDAFWA